VDEAAELRLALRGRLVEPRAFGGLDDLRLAAAGGL
jgi:hypothetical protein